MAGQSQQLPFIKDIWASPSNQGSAVNVITDYPLGTGEFKKNLSKMNFYNQYPEMFPYVGKNFGNARGPSILLVGESHYIEDDCPQRSSAAWYSGSSESLSKDQIDYISTRRLLEDSRETGFSVKAHVIFKNAFIEINDHGPRYKDYKLVADDIAFYNFFLRPAVDGGSLAEDVSNEDIAMANEAFVKHCSDLKPTAVVFLSRFAYNCCNTLPSAPVIATPHPGCQWWNRVAAKYGNKKGRDILGAFIKTINWPQLEA